MTTEKLSDAEARAALIAAARTMVARDGAGFSLKQLYAESGVNRAVFRRCFASKTDLLNAIVVGEVKNLGQIAEAMAPAQEVQVQQVVGGAPVAVASASTGAPSGPSVDAWLERRLRVFERALAALETRQDKSERELTRSLSLLEEKVAAPASLERREEPAPEPIARPVLQAVSAPKPAPTPVSGIETVTAPVTPALTAAETPVVAASETSLVAEESEELSDPVLDVLPEPGEEPIGEREIQDFIAHARAAAQRAVVPPPPARSLALPRWIAWMGVGLVTLLICVGLALGNVARATQASGIAYRAVPQDATARLMALADSGDARAQTLVALSYLRGQYGPSDAQAAMRWSLAAAQQGEPVAQYLAGALLSKDDAPGAFNWFQQAALHGNIKAMHNLAIAYAQGQGVSEDDKRAAAWFGRAANQGYVDSQFDLAVLFERGQGVTQNRVAALKWYLIASAHGDGPAAARARQLRAQMPAPEAARATMLAAAYVPQPHDQLANASP